MRETLNRWSRRRWAILSALFLAVLIIVIVPPAVILSGNHQGNSLPSAVLLPLYTYPTTENAWDPLFAALDRQPNLNWTIIINPDTGPGDSSGPNEDFTPVLKRLSTYANVRTIGYVHTEYATRNISVVLQEVEVYANWSLISSSLSVSGIFFDEAAFEYSDQSAAYLESIDNAVKNATGIQGSKLVVHNPGVIPDPRLIGPNTDITVAFEESEHKYRKLRRQLTSLSLDRERYCFMIHSVSHSLENLLRQSSLKAAHLFATNLKKDYYSSFGVEMQQQTKEQRGFFRSLIRKRGLRETKGSDFSGSSVVIVPLYIFPLTAESWSLLHQAISSSDKLQFLVILNPDSGPGKSPWWPNKDYVREIPRLTAHKNVTTVGYVPIDYCNRDIQDVQKDVNSYAGWRGDSNIPGCFVDGIFFDETPNEHSASKIQYLESITKFVKKHPELGQRIVIHNPGCLPDDQLKSAAIQPDITVVWEASHGRFQGETPPISHQDRIRNCVMLHSVPTDQVAAVTRSLQPAAKYIFLTSRREGFYEQFGDSWVQFIATMKEQ